MAKRRANDSGEFVTIRQGARRSGYGEKRIRSAVKARELTLYHVPGSWPRLRWRELEQWGSQPAEGSR